MKRGEVLSLRVSAEEKQRIQDAAARHQQPVGDFVRAAALRHVDEPAVTPSQTIFVTATAPATGANDDRLLLARLRRLIAQDGGHGL